ncbi:hypothetical protein Tco_0767869 [Tanacetum coccineum]
MEMVPDIENMTLNEYLEYEAEKERRLRRNVRSKSSPTRYEGADFNSSHRDKSITLDFLQYYEDTFLDKYYVFAQPPNTPNTPMDKKDFDFDEILDDLFRIEAENLCIYVWDIMVEDVERIRQILTPNVPNEMDEVIKPLIPQPIHTTPPNDHYVAPATKSILDELLEEFRDEILNVTMVDEEADFNPTKDIEELERLLAKNP